jgi:Tfp pilus assembly protein PilN
MIKINLATRKTSSVAGQGAGAGAMLAGLFSRGDSGEGGATKSFANLRFDQLNLEKFGDLPVAKVAIALVVVISAYFVESSMKAHEMAKVELAIAEVKKREEELQRQLSQTKGYDQLKKALDADEMMIKTKITVIRKLIHDRQTPPKLLLTLSNGLPPDVWISKFELADMGVKLEGMSLGGLNPVSDLMKNLGESTYFSDLKLISSKKGRDTLNLETDDFTLTAKRRELNEQ